ncbi:MAG: lipid-A-disaccharide synthase-related protein [Acidobacteriota bacterium]
MISSGPARVLFLSNGHGEDTIAAAVIDRLRLREPACPIASWPMVGAGEAYAERGITRVGPPNFAPSEGFGTLSMKWLWRDVRAGLIGDYRRQWVAARRLRGRFDLAVAVGDIVPALVAHSADLPYLFVGCAKCSSYPWRGRYHRVELVLIRRRCLGAFARDVETADRMARAGVPAWHVGNPMMDDLRPSTPLDIPADRPVVAMLPGSRADAVANACRLVCLARATAASLSPPERPHWVVAPARTFDLAAFIRTIAGPADGVVLTSTPSSAAGGGVRLTDSAGTIVEVLPGHFVSAVRRALVVVGMAGTANEQSVGLGRPLVALPATGPCGVGYLRMKAHLFGDAAVTVESGDGDAVAAVIALLRDPARRARMEQAGRRLMGPPGASDAIADAICAAARRLTP